MSQKDDLKIMYADEGWEGLWEAIAQNEANGPVMSWRTHAKMLCMRVLHPFGIHYLVPAYEHDLSSERWVAIGSTCWFCNG